MNTLILNTCARSGIAFVWALSASAALAQSSSTTPLNTQACPFFSEQHPAVMEKIKIQDDLLLEKVIKMHRANGENKIKLIADIVTDLARQRIAVNQWKAKMAEMIQLHHSVDMSL